MLKTLLKTCLIFTLNIFDLIKDVLKNCIGNKSYNRKIVQFSIDDYGSVRTASKKAKEQLIKSGLKIESRFDAFDAIETSEDLGCLFEVLSSVKDFKGNFAKFTLYTLPCNVDFDLVESSGFSDYFYEDLKTSFKKLEANDCINYKNTFKMWEEGINKSLIFPQFHGREHLSVRAFKKKLDKKDFELLNSIKNRSIAGISSSGIPNIKWSASFSYNNPSEIDDFDEILKTGTDTFESIFGFKSKTFTPPSQKFPRILESELHKYGITTMDKPFLNRQHLGNGKYKVEFNYLKINRKDSLNTIVRNVVFEPTNGNINHINKALNQIEAAFICGKPAIISSHRVNFSGLIDENNRKIGLNALKELLNKILLKWPDVEFVNSDELLEVFT